jgi:uncharacterized protein (DUF433 family)
MARRIKRITMFKADDPALDRDQAVLGRLVEKDLISLHKDGTVAVFPLALGEDLDDDERRVLGHLLGFEPAHRGERLIVKRPGFVEGRAVIAGTRVPVWRVWRMVQQGASQVDLRLQYGLSDRQIEAALRYATRHPEEVRRDVFDAERADEALLGVIR